MLSRRDLTVNAVVESKTATAVAMATASIMVVKRRIMLAHKTWKNMQPYFSEPKPQFSFKDSMQSWLKSIYEELL